MSFSLKGLIELDDALVSQLKQNSNFVHNLRSLFLLGEVLFVDAFDGDQFSSYLVHAEIDFAEGAPTEHFTSSVKLRLSFRGFISLPESLFNSICQLYYFSYTRTNGQTWLLFLLFIDASRYVESYFFSRKFTEPQCLLSNIDWPLISNFSWLWLAYLRS